MFETAGNAAAYFVDRHAEGARRDHPAFREAGGAGRTLTYGELGGAAPASAPCSRAMAWSGRTASRC